LADVLARTNETEALAGLVGRVTFHNAENGFCVLRVKARGQRDLITVVGHAATIAAGEFVQLSGSWVNDRTHKSQFGARMGFCNGRVRPSHHSLRRSQCLSEIWR
jgi:exodeoxyribonuclease V alpha subunit